MIRCDELFRDLRSQWESGKTQEELSRKSGVSRSYLCELLSGKRDIENMTIKKLNQLFPDSVFLTRGDHISITAERNRGNIVGVNRGTIGSDCLSAVMDKILSSEDLSDAEKVKVMKVLKK